MADTWTAPYYGVQHYPARSKLADLNAWATVCEFSPRMATLTRRYRGPEGHFVVQEPREEVFDTAEAARAAGEAWVSQKPLDLHNSCARVTTVVSTSHRPKSRR